VGEVMPALFVAEPIEDDLRLAIGDIVAIAIGDEIELRRRHHPHAPETDFDAGDIVQPLVKDLAADAASGVFQDDDAVLAGRLPGTVIEGFGHEDAATRIDAEGDWLYDIRLGGKYS